MTEVTWDEAPSLQNPLLVVAFEGWFDAGGARQEPSNGLSINTRLDGSPKSTRRNFSIFKKIVHMSKLLTTENDESGGRPLMLT